MRNFKCYQRIWTDKNIKLAFERWNDAFEFEGELFVQVSTNLLYWNNVYFIDSYKRSPLKNHDIKTPLVVSFSLWDLIQFSPLAAFWCQGSSEDSHYTFQEHEINDDTMFTKSTWARKTNGCWIGGRVSQNSFQLWLFLEQIKNNDSMICRTTEFDLSLRIGDFV